MPSERMVSSDNSPKLDVDLSESNLSFLSSLSLGKDEDSVLSDQLNINILNSLNTSNIVNTGSLENTFDLNLEKDNSESSSKIMTSSTSEAEQSIFNELLNVSESFSNTSMPTSSSFVFPAPTTKNVDLSTFSTSKITSNPVNKQGGTQVLILQKPVTNVSSMIMQAKNISTVASAGNVTIVQPPSITTSNAPKILTLPTLNASSNLINPAASASTMKNSDVKILLGQVQGASANFATTKQVNSVNTSAVQIPLKRSVTPSSTGQVITKVIITNNAATNQSIISPVPLSANVSSATVNTQSPSILLASPNKTFTLSRNVNVTGPQQVLRALPGTPAKQGMFVLSPVKSLQKPSMVPITIAKSPRRIAPATNPVITSLTTGSRVAAVVCPTSSVAATTVPTVRNLNVQQSPTKVILKSVTPQTILKPVIGGPSAIASTNFGTVVSSVQQSSGTTSQSIQVPGSKFHYVRLVSAPTTSTTNTVEKQATLIPVSNATSFGGGLKPSITHSAANTTLVASTQPRPIVPIAPAITTAKLVAPKQVAQRILIPAASGSQIRATNTVAAGQIGQIPKGTLMAVAPNSQSFVMLPAQYVTQLQQSSQSQLGAGVFFPHQNILPAPSVTTSSTKFGTHPTFVSITTSTALTSTTNALQSGCSPTVNLQLQSRHINGRAPPPMDTDSRPRKPCNCTKSQCLKLYCDCFANGEFCNNCNCNNCYNNLLHEEERQKAIKACLDRNPLAFHPKIGKSRGGDQERRHTKGCNCKRSGCLKNYCECYEAKILCTNICKCIGCKNFEDSSERKTLMHLADAAEVRVQQQAAAKTNLSSQILDMPTKPPIISRSGERLPFAFVTDEVLQATCLCLLAQAEDAERSNSSEEELERLVLQEFGRCLVQIIDSANKTKVSKMDVQ